MLKMATVLAIRAMTVVVEAIQSELITTGPLAVHRLKNGHREGHGDGI